MTKPSQAPSAGTVSVTPGTRLCEVARIMRERCVHNVPVRENGRLVGMVTDRAIAIRAIEGGQAPAWLAAREVMAALILS